MNLAEKINVVRASVMGANDGIISVAGIVLGVPRLRVVLMIIG